MKPCIVVVGYNRPDCLSNILQSIAKAIYPCNDIPLVISLDKAENDNECFRIATEFNWEHGEKIVRSFNERLGLRNHIIKCGDLTEKYGSVIILEDDLLVSPMFYIYASESLSFYENDPIITGISLYSHSWNGYANRSFQPIQDGKQTYLGQFSITWGECWTLKWWSSFKNWYKTHQTLLEQNPLMPSNINRWPKTSWGKYFITYMVEKNLYYVIPTISLSTNNSALGQHARYKDSTHQVALLESKDYRYCFCDSSELMEYDIFFENINLVDKCFSQYKEDGVCINLNGKQRSVQSRYLLTTKRLPFKVVESYGLELRPIEINVIQNVPGSVIFLYDLHVKARKPKDNKFSILKYEFKGLSIKDSLRYSIKYFWFKATNKLHGKK